MFMGKVVGSVWSTVKWPQLNGLKLLTVQPYHVSDLSQSEQERFPTCHDIVVCADVIDAGIGDRVIVAYGHAARVAIAQCLQEGQKPEHPIDAAVVAIVDDLSL